MPNFGRRRQRRGQIIVPSIFVLPSLFLFVFLIFETAKLSREKIRHQFAVDAAAFVEATNYSDFLNRTAYVNGAFPERIFHEGFYETNIEAKNTTTPAKLYHMLYDNGAFPGRRDAGNPLPPLDEQSVWGDLRFGGFGMGKNDSPPNLSGSICRNFSGSIIATECLDIISGANAVSHWVSWDDAQDIYKLYVQIYQLLGSVEDAQYAVFERLTKGSRPHTFYRKSYWLNTGDDVNSGDDGAAQFQGVTARAYCLKKVMIYGNKPTSNAFQPYQIYAPKDPIEMPPGLMQTMRCEGSNDGLFQVAWVPPADLSRIGTDITGSGCHGRSGNDPGMQISQPWTAPGNYFNVDFSREFPGNRQCVHATVQVANGKVWPEPTPKFQVRLRP